MSDTNPRPADTQSADPLAAAKAQMASVQGAGEAAADTPLAAVTSDARVERRLNIPRPERRMIDSLTEAEQAQARQIAASIKFEDDTSVIMFGNDVKSEIAKFTAMIAGKVSVGETDEIGELLLQVKRVANDLNVGKLKGKQESAARRWLAKKLTFLRGLISEMEDFAARRGNAERALVGLEQQLQERKAGGIEDAEYWRTMKGVNTNLLGGLQIRAAAAEIKLEELEQEYLRRVEEIKGTDDLRKIDAVAEFADRIELFASTLQNIYKARLQTHQRGPKIKIGEQTANRLIQLVDDLIEYAIPNIRMEAAAYILSAKARRMHAHAAAVQEMNERSMVQGAKILADNQRESLRAQARGIGTIQSLRETHTALINMLDEGLRLREENRRIRAEEQAAMQEMEREQIAASERFVRALAERKSTIHDAKSES